MHRTILIVTTALALCSTASAMAQDHQSKPAIAYKSDGLWGLVDQQGNVVMAPQFEKIFVDDSGTVRAEKNNLKFVYDSRGRLLTDSELAKEPDYDADGLAVVVENGRSGLKNKSGDFVLKPQFAYVHRFGPPLQYVVHYNGGVGVIDLGTNKWVISNNFQYIDKLSKSGLAVAKRKELKGFINNKGDWVLQPGVFEEINAFDDFDLAVARKDGKCGFINSKFEWAIRPISEEKYCFFGFDDAGLYRFKVGEKIGLLNRNGAIVADPTFDEIDWFANGFYAARVGKKWGYLNSEGAVSIAPRFDLAGRFNKKGIATVELDGQDFVISSKGKILFGKKFEALGHFGDDDWASAKLKGKWGAIDQKGRWIVSPKYDCISWCAGDPPPTVQLGGRLYFRPDVE